MDAQSTSQRLKLLQDISSLSGILPDSYWISDITKGKRISSGAEAIVYRGQQGNRTVVVRQFHHAESDIDSELRNISQVRI